MAQRNGRDQSVEPYEKLRAWQLCHALILLVFKATKVWPKEERYGLVAQIRRAAWSAVANIVEGSARRGKKELARFLDISIGSLAELGYGLRLARELEYMDHDAWRKLEAARASAARVTWLLYRSLRRDES